MVGDADLLRAFREALLAIGTATGPRFYIGESFAKSFGKLLLLGGVIDSLFVRKGQDMTVYSLVVISKVAWNVNAIGTRHAIAAGGTGNDRKASHHVGNLFQ